MRKFVFLTPYWDYNFLTDSFNIYSGIPQILLSIQKVSLQDREGKPYFIYFFTQSLYGNFNVNQTFFYSQYPPLTPLLLPPQTRHPLPRKSLLEFTSALFSYRPFCLHCPPLPFPQSFQIPEGRRRALCPRAQRGMESVSVPFTAAVD
jgi:hypothetical protein